MDKKNVVLLGATGSIGASTIQVLQEYSDRFNLIAVSAHHNVEALAKIADRFGVAHVGLFESHFERDRFPKNCVVHVGFGALETLATLPEADIIVVGSSGLSCLSAVLSAVKLGKTVALANKECIVAAGELIAAAVSSYSGKILPVDSEHNAIFQCLPSSFPGCFHEASGVEKVILTASGGPFLRLPRNLLERVTYREALQHPRWTMGKKISIDSATLANKGMEVIEARWLFQLNPRQIEVLIHPESVVHSLVQFCDGSLLAQLSPPSMTYPLRFCLNYPNRQSHLGRSLDLVGEKSLNFEAPDRQRFPCLRLAEEAMRQAGSAPCIFEAANEVAVSAFLQQRIRFLEIPEVIESVLGRVSAERLSSLEDILAKHDEAQTVALEQVKHLSSGENL